MITSISFDHMQYLGNTIEETAGEKAGIVVPGVPVIYERKRSKGGKGHQRTGTGAEQSML